MLLISQRKNGDVKYFFRFFKYFFGFQKYFGIGPANPTIVFKSVRISKKKLLSANYRHICILNATLILSWAKERILADLKDHLLFENVSNKVVYSLGISYHNFGWMKTITFLGH